MNFERMDDKLIVEKLDWLLNKAANVINVIYSHEWDWCFFSVRNHQIHNVCASMMKSCSFQLSLKNQIKNHKQLITLCVKITDDDAIYFYWYRFFSFVCWFSLFVTLIILLQSIDICCHYYVHYHFGLEIMLGAFELAHLIQNIFKLFVGSLTQIWYVFKLIYKSIDILVWRQNTRNILLAFRISSVKDLQ